MNLDDLPEPLRRQALAKLGEPPTPRRGKGNRASGVATNGVCHGCGVRFTSTRAWERHSDTSGHRRFDLMVNGEPV